jgi:hypothetical protein
MNIQDQPVYVLTSTDVERILNLLSMFSRTLERIFERAETSLYTGDDEFMEDLSFYIKSGARPEDI